MHKIDLSHNRIKISKLLTIQVVMMLFAILVTYKWAINYVDIIEQRFLTNVIYGILGFIGVLIIHELIHKYLFFIFSKGQKPQFKYKNGILLIYLSSKYFNKWQFCAVMLAPLVIITIGLMLSFYHFAYSSIIFISSIHIGYCLIDIYLTAITIINKFKYIHFTDEGIFMYHHLPISINNDYE
ncbi:DUF3267 domain-containing protein [Staphylococcus hominis]|uniref:DUF3267 domain-containing protein n=1 Tax=Staphylococcus hominis TaxID=1290 RepID=UPI00019FB3B1|nr:DUF3267 domain-containing protein [Staphylococcus hominis]EEK11128.1 hypothetical protein STAHO0001_0050 [Staphylococcus hominis SK119]MDS3856534.1 DUF3267 domain-containing protein [Staphylococcus hominis]MDS3882709.1 DUF3267 domain-containing protein [Staphylococcus hominis]QKH81752.1 DUF3267 domain-containing protein [Staphylococcus hominis]